MNEADRQMLLKAQALIEQRREWERGYSTRPPLGAGVMAANIEGQDRKKITLPEQAVIWASMGLSSMVYKRTGAFRLYVLARSLDPQGSGHVSIADLKQAALHLKVKYSTFYAWLAEAFACGVFVRVGEKTVRGVGENTVRVVPGNTVKVRSQEAAFKIFGCKFLDKTKSSIPLKRLFAKDWRARVFAAYVQANHNGEIISLEKLEDLTGIPARTLKKSNLGKFVTAKRQYSVLDRSADAVPGWFQATLALYDGNRAEVAFADDYGFEPDPVVFFMIPKDGVYEIEIRDSIYRGREDFVYRVAVGEMPFITSIYPLGAREGERATVNLTGWNILDRRLSLDTSPGESIIRYATLSRNKLCNRVPYAVDTLPEADEAEANDRPNDAQKIDLPVTINGRIYKPGDVDWFEFKGQAGQEVVAEVYAHRLNSMLDSLLRLTDAEGKVVAWNDDYDNKEMGLQTRHADSYLSAKLPAAGVYRIQLADATRHGSDYHAYRLRVSAPRPDFGLRLMPSGATVPAGRVLPITVYAFRRDGFAGDIEVSLDESASGFHLSGGRIPAGVESIRMTLTAPPKDLDQPASLKLVGRASVAGRTVSRQVVPADDMMQAFIYHHLVPRDELAISVTKARFIAPAGQVASAKPLEIPRGGQATAKVVTGQKPNLTGISFSLNQPPQGISLGKVTPAADGLEFELKADAKAAELGRADNLIIEVFSVNQGRRYSISMVPAIPIQVVGQ